MDNYWATMRDEQYVQMVGENNKKGEWVSPGCGGHYHRLGSGRGRVDRWGKEMLSRHCRATGRWY